MTRSAPMPAASFRRYGLTSVTAILRAQMASNRGHDPDRTGPRNQDILTDRAEL